MTVVVPSDFFYSTQKGRAFFLGCSHDGLCDYALRLIKRHAEQTGCIELDIWLAHCQHAAEQEEHKEFLGQVPLLERSGQEHLPRGGARSFTPARASPWRRRPLAPAGLPMPQQGA